MDSAKTYIEVLGKFYDETKLNKRFCVLRREIETALNKLNIKVGQDVIINNMLLSQAVCDYFIDVYKLKQFEHIDKTNVQKIYGYSIYWLLRRKPIQVISEDKKLAFINERVVIHILIALLVKSKFGNVKALEPNKIAKKIQGVLDNLFYNLKYRDYSTKTLELFLDAYLMLV